MPSVRRLALVCAGLFLAAARPAFGFHTFFHFQVDRFEADGNVFGPRDGVPDFVDDFTGDSYAPDWIHLFGTVSVSGGSLHLQNPGEHFSVGFPVDVSEVWSNAVVSLPMGGVTVTSYWVAPTLTLGSSLHMTLALTGSDGHDEFVGLHVQNNASSGPTIGLHFLEIAGQDWQPLQVESVPYDATAASDRIALRLVLDAGMVTGSVSLDGGTTFTTPFTPGVVLPHIVSGRVMLGADPMVPMPPRCGNGVVEAGEACDLGRRQNGKGCCTDACTLVDRDGDGTCDPRDDCPDLADPTHADGDHDGLGDACDPCTATADGQSRWTRPLVAVARLNDDRPGNESLRVSGSFGFATDGAPFDPVATGAQLTLRSGKDGSTVTVALPPGPYVAPGPGWLADDTGTKFTFLDRRRGGSGGVRRMGVRRTADGRIRVDVSAPHGAFNFGAWSFPPIHAAVAFGDTTNECGEILFDDHACAYPQSRRIVCR
jgi:hypothetical protein